MRRLLLLQRLFCRCRPLPRLIGRDLRPVHAPECCIDVDDGTVTQVTRGDMNEQVVSFTADGQQVIFYVEHYEKESKGRYLTAYVVGIGG